MSILEGTESNVVRFADHNAYKKSEQIVISAHLFRTSKDNSKSHREESRDAR